MKINALMHLVIYEWVKSILSKGWFTLGPKFEVPLMLASPNMEAKSQPLSLEKPLFIWLIII